MGHSVYFQMKTKPQISVRAVGSHPLVITVEKTVMILSYIDSHDSIGQVMLSLKSLPSNIAPARHASLH